MKVPGWKRVRHFGRWVRSRVSGSALILGYHRVAEVQRDPFGLCVRPRYFDEQMQVLRALARPVALSEVIDPVRGAAGRRRVAVTFDDGYRDFAMNAEPVLRRHNIPATVFVVSGSLGRRLWWDELAQLMRGTPSDATLTATHRWLIECSAQEREQFLAQLRSSSDAAATAGGDEVMDERELARLGESRLISIGSHTVNHVPLGAIPDIEQLYELRESRRQLEAVTGRPVRQLSYPHGSNGPVTRRLAMQSGYRSACASTPDAVSRRTDPFCLPRFWAPDWDGDRFARWLHKWAT